MVKPVEETQRVYEVTLDDDVVVTISAASNNGEGIYGFTLENFDNYFFSVNDTEHLVAALNAATDWINKNAEDSE